jgi:undecaprenyl-diphosphatase
MTTVAQQILKIDSLVLKRLTGPRIREERAVRIVRWISKTADGQAYPAFLIVLAAMQSDRWKVFSIFLFSFAVELAAYKLIKRLVKRPRPFDTFEGLANLIVPQDFFSFPSGHTAGAFVVAMSIISCYPGWAIPAYAWAVLVGFSRIYLGVHYPTDVLAGAGLGMLSVKAGLLLANCVQGSSIF